jgi:hypothetical protein
LIVFIQSDCQQIIEKKNQQYLFFVYNTITEKETLRNEFYRLIT